MHGKAAALRTSYEPGLGTLWGTTRTKVMDEITSDYHPVVEEICGLEWPALNQSELSAVAWAYYYFSIQFRQNLECALEMHPDDVQLQRLFREECATDNLSPWPGVAAPNESMHHDEFMKRVLTLSPIEPATQTAIEAAGQRYLSKVGQADDHVKVMSLASYEAGGLESVFKAILQAPQWSTPLLEGFRHFLEKHISFDSDPRQGHGALVRHLVPDHGSIRHLWVAFRDLLVTAVPRLLPE
jgi:hypothetical protein